MKSPAAVKRRAVTPQIPLACEAPLLGGVDDDAGVSAPVLVADPDGVAAAAAEDPGALVEEDAAGAVDAGTALEDEVVASLIPQTAWVSNSVGMGLFQARQPDTPLSIASIENIRFNTHTCNHLDP